MKENYIKRLNKEKEEMVQELLHLRSDFNVVTIEKGKVDINVDTLQEQVKTLHGNVGALQGKLFLDNIAQNEFIDIEMKSKANIFELKKEKRASENRQGITDISQRNVLMYR